MTNKEKPKAVAYFAALEHGDAFKRRQALHELARLETETDDEELAIHQHAVVARLEDSDGQVRKAALQTLGQLGKLEPTWLARHASDVVARLEDSEAGVRTAALETMGRLEQARLDLYAHILIPMLEDSSWDVREGAIIALGFLEPDKIVRQTGDYVNVRDVRLRALQTLFKLEPAMLAQHADAVLARLEDWDDQVRKWALETLSKLEPATFAQHVDAVLATLKDSSWDVRAGAMIALGTLEPATLAQHVDALGKGLRDPDCDVCKGALETLGKLEPATLAQHADAVVYRLNDRAWYVRLGALQTLGKLEPATLAQHADAVLARLENYDYRVRKGALQTLGKLEPATLAQHADAVLARLEDEPEPHAQVRKEALMTLAKLEPAKLAQYANAVLAMLEDVDHDVREEAMRTLRALPRFVTRPGDFFDTRSLRSRLLGRLGWYRCRLPLRVQRVALYWYALPYRPSGPGHARVVEAWGRIAENQDHKLGITTAATRRKRCKTDMHAGTQPNERQTRLRSRNSKSPRSE